MIICNICGNMIPTGDVCSNCGNVIINEIPTEQETTIDESPIINPGKKIGVFGLVLSLLAFVIGACCTCVLNVFGPPLQFFVSVVALVVSIIAIKKSKKAGFKNKFAKVAIVFSICSFIVSIIYILLSLVGFFVGGTGAIIGFFEPIKNFVLSKLAFLKKSVI